MRTFIQLRDSIGYATVITPAGEPDHTVTPEDTNAIEVFTDNPDQFLNKKYNAESNSWSDSPLITYAIVADDGSILEIRNTYFNFDIKGPVIETDISLNSKWVNNQWLEPTNIEASIEHIEPIIIEPIEIVTPVYDNVDTIGDN
jgi:hypothetical protein